MKVDLTQDDILLLVQLLNEVTVKLNQATVLMELRDKLLEVKK